MKLQNFKQWTQLKFLKPNCSFVCLTCFQLTNQRMEGEWEYQSGTAREQTCWLQQVVQNVLHEAAAIQ